MARRKHDLTIKPSKQDVEAKVYRKANQEIGFRIKTGQLTFLSRKLFNVLVYYTQHSDEEEDGRWWIPLSDVTRDAAVNSNDYAAIKKHLSELQNVRVIRETQGEYLSEVLVSSVKIVNAIPGAARGGRTMLGWAFPPEVKKQFQDPQLYTRLSLFYQTMLRTIGGLTLYEVCKRYATNPSGVTNRAPWRWWWEYMTGVTVGTEPPVYKYFKRDVLKPAVNEVNAITDIEVELIEYRDGRFVSDLQFRVKRKAQQSLDLPAPPVIDTELFRRILQFGVSQDETERLVATIEEKLLRDTIEFVERRKLAQNSPPVDNLAAYFKAAIKGRYAENGPPPPKLPRPKKEESTESSPKRDNPDKYASLREAFRSLPEDEKLRQINSFAATLESPIVAELFRKSGLKAKRNEILFLEWFASQASAS